MIEPLFGRLYFSILVGVLVPLLLGGAPRASDAGVTLSIKNSGTQPLRCLIVFGHWVTTDVGPIAPGTTATVAMTRGPQPGALHVARFDGRQMMIENIVCGAVKDWSDSLEQLPLTSVRDGAGSAYDIACRAKTRLTCAAPRAIP
jgi:hypothetical protein